MRRAAPAPTRVCSASVSTRSGSTPPPLHPAANARLWRFQNAPSKLAFVRRASTSSGTRPPNTARRPCRPVEESPVAAECGERREEPAVGERVNEPRVGVRREELEALHADLEVPKPCEPAHAGSPAQRLVGGLVGERPQHGLARGGTQPGEPVRPPAAEDGAAQRHRREGKADAEGIARLRAGRSRGERGRALPLRGGEGLVPADPRQERAALGRIQKGRVEVDVRRPEDAVAAQDGRRDRADHVQLVVARDPNPVVETQPADDALLPLGLVALGRARHDVRGRHGRRQSLAPRECGREDQHRRGVPPAREAHQARRALERRQERPLEGRDRVEPLGIGERDTPVAAEHEPAGELERRERGRRHG